MRNLTIGTVVVLASVIGACDADRDADIDADDISLSYEDARSDIAEATEGLREDIDDFIERWDINADLAFDADEFKRWWSEANPFRNWDTDQNDRLALVEWDAVLQLDMREVDENGDGVVTRAELERGLFDALDQNDDGRIERAEWRRIEV
jgi:Ca2+-binding EF-hand superfamily protein